MSLKKIIKEEMEDNKVTKITKSGIFIPIKKGDIILTGRFRNKETEVKSIKINEHGLPIINGRNITNFRFKEG